VDDLQERELSLRRQCGLRLAVVITVTALGIESAALRERFEKRGLAASVFTYEEGDLAAKR
jgi:hypothetical protein